MDFLKENAENRFVSNTRNIKGNLTGLKQMKQAVKPLSDVKNILSENICIPQNKVQQKSKVETTNKVQEVEEYGYDELCFYNDNFDDDYGDIIPRALQLNSDDIRRLANVFDRKEFETPSILSQKFEPLPLERPSFERDDLLMMCSVGFDPNDGLFEVEENIMVF